MGKGILVRSLWVVVVVLCLLGGVVPVHGQDVPHEGVRRRRVTGMACAHQADVIHEPYLLDTGLVSRSISFENPTGARRGRQGGQQSGRRPQGGPGDRSQGRAGGSALRHRRSRHDPAHLDDDREAIRRICGAS